MSLLDSRDRDEIRQRAGHLVEALSVLVQEWSHSGKEDIVECSMRIASLLEAYDDDNDEQRRPESQQASTDTDVDAAIQRFLEEE